MYAIIEASGSQIKVAQGDILDIDLVESGNAAAGKALSFDKVLLVGGSGATKVGSPYVAGAKVAAEVLEPLVKGEKLIIQYFQPKKMSRRRTGHRQQYTKIKITGITA